MNVRVFKLVEQVGRFLVSLAGYAYGRIDEFQSRVFDRQPPTDDLLRGLQDDRITRKTHQTPITSAASDESSNDRGQDKERDGDRKRVRHHHSSAYL